MELDPHRLTTLERWVVDASDWQFDAVSGAIGGFTSGVVTCPLDVIKTKLQAQGGFQAVRGGQELAHSRVYEGLVGTAKVIWRQEGVRGLYRGLGPIILGYLPTWAVWFTVYNRSKKYLAQYHRECAQTSCSAACLGRSTQTDMSTDNTFVINFWSSIIAGASSTLATNPIWVIKTRLMSQTPHHDRSRFSYYPKSSNTPTSRPMLHTPWQYRSTLDAARKMYTTEGIASFYSGLTPALLGLTHVAVQFPAYEYLKLKLTGRPMGGATPNAREQAARGWLGILSASILSKILASSATYPHEVIRTRLQTQRRPVPGYEYMEGLGGGRPTADARPGDTRPGGSGPAPAPAIRYRGIAMTFRTILREEGWRAFYAGMGTNMMRAVPAATVTMCTYEFVMGHLKVARITGQQKRAAYEERLDIPATCS